MEKTNVNRLNKVKKIQVISKYYILFFKSHRRFEFSFHCSPVNELIEAVSCVFFLLEAHDNRLSFPRQTLIDAHTPRSSSRAVKMALSFPLAVCHRSRVSIFASHPHSTGHRKLGVFIPSIFQVQVDFPASPVP